MKKRLGLMAVVAILGVVLLGGTMAAYQAGTTAHAKESTSKLGIQLIQEGDGKPGEEEQYSDARQEILYTGMPGDLVNKTLKAKNTGRKDLYVRITISKAWLYQNGEKNLDADSREIEIITNDKDNWIVQEGDEYGEVIYYYYRKPLSPGEETMNVMDQFSILRKGLISTGNEYTNLASQITFEADAIQKTAAEKAILAEWGIIAEIDDENGNIVSVQEQGGEEAAEYEE